MDDYDVHQEYFHAWNTSMHVPIECFAALMTQYCHAAARSVLATRQPFNMSHNTPCSFIVIALSYSDPRELGLFTPRVARRRVIVLARLRARTSLLEYPLRISGFGPSDSSVPDSDRARRHVRPRAASRTCEALNVRTPG